MRRISKANLRIIQSGFLIFIISLFLYRIPIYNQDAKKWELHSSLLGMIDELWLNFLIRHYSSATSKENRIVLLLYDNKTKEELNIKGPVPPSFFLKLLNKLTNAKAKVIAFDITLADYGDNPEQKQFIEESISHNVIHTVHRNIDNSLIFSMDNPKLPVLGSINLGTDTIKKKVEPYFNYNNKKYFFMPFQIAALYKGEKTPVVTDKELQIRDIKIPLDYSNKFFIKYYKNMPREIFQEIKIEEILNDNINTEIIKDNIVIVASKTGISHDRHPTPLGNYLGSEIIAIIIKNILDKTFISQVNILYIIISTLCLLSLQALLRKRPVEIFSATVVLLSLPLFASCFFFLKSYYIEISLPLIAVTLNYIFLSFNKAKEVEDLLNIHSSLISKLSHSALKEQVSTQKWFEMTLELICKSIGGKNAAILLFDKGAIKIFCSYNIKDAQLNNISDYILKDLLPTLKKEHQLIINAQKKNPEIAKELGAGQLALFLLLGKEREIGILYLGKEYPEYFSKEHIREVLLTSLFAGVYLEDSLLIDKKKQGFLESIFALANTIDARDVYTHDHSKRVSEISEAIARKMNLPEIEVANIKNAGTLHDIGKIGIPESILKKEGKLTEDEFKKMQEHPVISAKILHPIEEMKEVVPLVLYHHEKFSGGGYPDNKKMDEIPLGARILAVADTYDAMTSDRPYRKGMPKEKALEEMLKIKGTQLDPAILDILLEIVR